MRIWQTLEPLDRQISAHMGGVARGAIQGYLARKKQPPPLGLPYDPRYSPTDGS